VAREMLASLEAGSGAMDKDSARLAQQSGGEGNLR
jgi:hypothetical protein